MGNCYKFAIGKKDTVEAVGVWAFLNDKDGVWLRRNNDGDGGNPKRLGKTAKRATTGPRWGVRTQAISDAGMGAGVLTQHPSPHTSFPLPGSRISPQPLIQSQPLMPRSKLGAPGPGRMGGVRLPGPLALSQSSVEPELNCNGVDNFIVLALVIMLACIGLKKFRRVQKVQGMQEPLMDCQ